ncbi:MAG: DUF4139 domain-containing protein [Caldithrix sp.]|nr:MAG: DUF4139 domain-containing protein [Caldithrix sp.]
MKNRIRKILYSIILFLICAANILAQDKEIGLTIYNNNLALVRDVRTLQLTKGISEIKFQDVAAQIDPTSVYFASLTAPDKVVILEQNYEYDLVNTSKILQKYIEQEIRLETKEGTAYSGTLLNASGKDIILRESDGGIKIVRREAVENMAFPKLPDGLITRPTLVWSIDCQQAGKHKTEVGYLTNGIQWHAEYVGVVNKDDTVLELSGWVSLDNKSGATYENAKLKLVAGDVHRAQDVRPFRRGRVQTEMMVSSAPQFAEKAFFEYHIYTLQRPATVANNQIKQISLFSPAETKVNKTYSYDGARDRKKVRVNLEFENKKASGLGMPLPKGKVRVYKRDDDKSLIFIGEDFIDHTPKDEKVRVYVGNAFDIVGERTQKDRKSVGKTSWQESWQIKLRNHKDKTVRVTVIEHLRFGWEILQNTRAYKKKDAATIEFSIEIARDAEVVVEYVVRYNK